MPAGYSFHPRAWILVLGALGAGAGIALGNWQAGRAEDKRSEARQVDRRAVTGEFLPAQVVLLDNKIRRGRAGYEVVMPLKISTTEEHVLVNRGWIAAPPNRAELPHVRTPSGAVVVEGVARRHFPRVLEVGDRTRQIVRQTLDIDEFRTETGLSLLPYYIEQHSSLPDGLDREWQRPDAGVEKHESYALQWYSLAGLAAVLALVFSFRRRVGPS